MADKNPYGWGLSRNLPILIILLVILGFLTANVITLNNIAIAPEDPNQTVSKNSASGLYWFNLIILIFVLIVIILLIMFMYRNKNTPNVDYFGKNITIIGDKTGKEITKQNQEYKDSLAAAAAAKYKLENPELNNVEKSLCIFGGINVDSSKECNDFLNKANNGLPINLSKDCKDNFITDPRYCTLIENSIKNSEGFCHKENIDNFGVCYDKAVSYGLGNPRVISPTGAGTGS